MYSKTISCFPEFNQLSSSFALSETETFDIHGINPHQGATDNPARPITGQRHIEEICTSMVHVVLLAHPQGRHIDFEVNAFAKIHIKVWDNVHQLVHLMEFV